MDYEKKYKEALERAKQFSETPYLKDSKGIVEYIFPELAESEEERIRKNIIATIHLYYGEPLEEEAKEMIAWLEKQGDRKIQSEDEKKIKKEIIDKVCKWLVKHWREYVWLTDNDIIHFGHWSNII